LLNRSGRWGVSSVAITPLPFASAFAKLEIAKDSFDLKESFTLGANSYGINPLLEKRALIEFLSVAFGSRHSFNGRRIELSRDFDAVQLRRAIEVLEGF
jgi:hypothetical protein